MYPGPTLPEELGGHTIVSINETYSMLIGGAISNSVSKQCSNKTWFFNHQNKKWNLGPVLGRGRCLHTAGIIKDRKTNEEFVAIVGGFSFINGIGGVLRSVELLDLQSNMTRYGIEFKHFISERGREHLLSFSLKLLNSKTRVFTAIFKSTWSKN